MTDELKSLDLVSLGRRIRAVRESRKLTRERLAELLDLSPQFIADVEYGNKGVSVKTLYQISQILEVSAEYLLSGEIYDIEKNAKAAKACKEIEEIVNDLDVQRMQGFREISRVYIDMINNTRVD